MRVKIIIEGHENYDEFGFEFYINEFPARLIVGDIVHLSEMSEGRGLTEKQESHIDDLSWSVVGIGWGKDIGGIYQMVFCNGE
jgi:hypothetical protein